MHSTLGRRASICKELGFTLDFVEHGISYAKLQMLLLDMPRIIHNKDKKGESIELNDENADEVYQFMVAHGARIKE